MTMWLPTHIGPASRWSPRAWRSGTRKDASRDRRARRAAPVPEGARRGYRPSGAVPYNRPKVVREPFTEARLLTVNEVADLLRVSRMTVYRLIKSGEMPALRVGRNYRLRE